MNAERQIMQTNFERKAKINDIRFKYAKGKSERHGLEMHPYHEIIFFMEGNVTLYLETQRVSLARQTLLIIPKSTYHNFSFADENKYHRVVINFFDIPEYDYIIKNCMTKYILIARELPNLILDVLARIIHAFDDRYSVNDRNILLPGYFGELLVNLKFAEMEQIRGNQNDNSLVGRMIEYIKSDFHNPVNADSIADRFFISKSTVEHLFKKEMNIPLGRYIAETRLNHAYSLLLKDVPSTQVAVLCGYKEYSTFYRAFRQMFSMSPVEVHGSCYNNG